MNEIKQAIDDSLKEVRLSGEDILKRVVRKEEKRHYFTPRKKMQLVLCTLLLGTTIYAAGAFVQSTLRINKEVMPELAPMYVVAVNEVEGEKKDINIIEKHYEKMTQIEEDLGVNLLGTEYSQQNPYISIHYEKIGEGYNLIKVSNYETGDLQDIELCEQSRDALDTQGRNESYIWTLGEVYKTPIDLEIEIISSKEQSFLDKEYMGYFKYVETYTSQQGYRVNILEDTIDEGADIDLNRYQSKVEAVFVADGLRYTLSGRVPVETMKQVINAIK